MFYLGSGLRRICTLHNGRRGVARTFKILSAVEPSKSPGFFFDCLKKTMEKFCPEPHRAGMVRYVAADPIKPEFEVYENMGFYTGLPGALLGSGNVVNPEVGVFFSQELVSLIRVWHSKGEKGGFVNTIPLPGEIESTLPASPEGQLTSPEDDVKSVVDNLSNQRMVVFGNSNLKIISEELSKTIKALSSSNILSTFLPILLKFLNLLTISN